MVVYHEPLHWCWVLLAVSVISGDQAASRGYICSPIAVTLSNRVETTLHMVNCDALYYGIDFQFEILFIF